MGRCNEYWWWSPGRNGEFCVTGPVTRTAGILGLWGRPSGRRGSYASLIGLTLAGSKRHGPCCLRENLLLLLVFGEASHIDASLREKSYPMTNMWPVCRCFVFCKRLRPFLKRFSKSDDMIYLFIKCIPWIDY